MIRNRSIRMRRRVAAKHDNLGNTAALAAELVEKLLKRSKRLTLQYAEIVSPHLYPFQISRLRA